MNSIFRSVLIAIMIFLTASSVSAQVALELNYENLPSHPRLLLLPDKENEIRETIESDEIWAGIHNFIIGESDRIIDLPPVQRVLIGRRLLDKSREALRRIFYLSYSWRMTSDDRYLERAEKELIAVSAFSDWNPSHFLDVAEMTMAVAIGYDWLYNGLSDPVRQILKTAIVEKGLKMSLDPSFNSWLKATHNWNQVCNAGMTFGALAVMEDYAELSKSIIERARTSIMLPMADYEPDGAYPEGYSYWGYGTTFNIMFLSVVEKLFGQTFLPVISNGFMKTAEYMLNMTGPSGICFNYSDCGQGGSFHPAMLWFASRLNDPSVLWSEKFHLLNKGLPNDRLLPAAMIWGAGITIDKITPPKSLIWVGQGKNPVALLRTSWTDNEAIFVEFKAGSPSVNHGHMDIGSFVMDANGERWAMDFGPQDYNSLETSGVNLWSMQQNSQRWEVFRYNNFVHNTLTVDNQLQKVNGYANILKYSGNPKMINAVADISGVYAENLKKAIRGIAIVEQKYVIVRDEIETPEENKTVRWTLLTPAEVTITGKNTAELSKNGKKMILKVVSPSNVEMKTWSTDPPHKYDAENPGTVLTGFETIIPANTKAVLTVILMPEGTVVKKRITNKKLSSWPAE